MAQIDCAVAIYLCTKVSVVSDVKPRGISKEMHLRQLASTRDAEGNLLTFAMKTVLRSTETLVHVVCEVLIKQA